MATLKLTREQMAALEELAAQHGWKVSRYGLERGYVALQVPGEPCAQVIYHPGEKGRRQFEARLQKNLPVAKEIKAICTVQS